MGERIRSLSPSDSRIPVAVATLALAIGVLSEIGRVFVKGSNYAYATLNDAHYYAAMAARLWQSPLGFTQEIEILAGLDAVSEQFGNISSSDFGQTGYYWHEVNGLSHQPPYAYRVLEPTAVGLINDIGIPIGTAQFLLYLVGVVLLAVFSYVLVAGKTHGLMAPVFVSLGASVAALATTSPGYPDMLFIGLLTASIYFASNQMFFPFMIAAGLTSLTRETGLLLVPIWIAYLWANRNFSVLRSFPAFVPIVIVIMLRYLVEVPESSIDFNELKDFVNWRFSPYILFGVYSIITIGLISPRIARSLTTRKQNRVAIAETIIWVIGALAAFAGMLLATNTSRMALLSMPLFFAASGWIGLRSYWWLSSVITATLGYTIADTLANRSDAPFNQDPWKITAALVISVQVTATVRELFINRKSRVKA